MGKRATTSKKEQFVLYVYVGSAGIGRMGFGSWFGDEEINRSDGDDAGTYESLVDALEAVGIRIEALLSRAQWLGKPVTPIPLMSAAKAKENMDVLAVRITSEDAYNGLEFRAEWMWCGHDGYAVEAHDDPDAAVGQGDSLREALVDLGTKTQNELAHTAWVSRFR